MSSGTVVWTDVTAFVPFLSVVPVPAQDGILAHVNTVLSADNFGGEGTPKLNLARIYLAAHMGTLLQRGILAGASGAFGFVSGSTAGRLSRTYAQVTKNGRLSPNSSTIWGSLYDDIVATTPAAVGVVVS